MSALAFPSSIARHPGASGGRGTAVALCAFVALVAPVGPVGPVGPAASGAGPDPTAAAAAAAVDEPLPLAEAVAMALRNNADIRVRGLEMKVDDERIKLAWGAFDPTFQFGLTSEHFETPQNTQEYVSTGGVAGETRIFEEENVRSSLTFGGRTPLGTQFSLGMRVNRLDNTLNRVIPPALFNPEYPAFAGIELRQPLLRNFGPAANLAEVRISRVNREISRFAWETRAVETVAGVMATYYEMQFRRQDVGVREEALAADQQLLQQNRRRLELGFMTPVDVMEAEVAVSEDEERLLVAKNAYAESQFKLKRQILGEREEGARRTFTPVGRLEQLPRPDTGRAALLDEALARRADYRSARKEIDRENIRIRYARNQIWPQIDLVATYGVNGLGDGIGDGLGNALDGKTPSVTFGVQASIPWGGVQARAQLAATKTIKQQAILKLKQIEMNIGIDVDTILSRIETNRQRVATADTTVRLAEETRRVAMRRLEEGQLSSFDVLDQLKALYNARSRQLAAVADYNVAVVSLWQATGTVLDRFNIFIDE